MRSALRSSGIASSTSGSFWAASRFRRKARIFMPKARARSAAARPMSP